MDPIPPYLRRRSQEERATAAAASSAEAQRAHLELAFRYEKLAAELGVSGSAGGAPSPLPGNEPDISHRAVLGKVIGSAFPLPESGAFPDLLEALDEAEGRITALRD